VNRKAEVHDPDDTPEASEQALLAPSRTFLVRLRKAASGAVTGVVEAVRTGEKQRFEGTGAIGPVIDKMLAGPDAVLPGGTDAP
jgi:hypothetical protein